MIGELLIFIGLGLLYWIFAQAGGMPVWIPVSLIVIGAALRAVAILKGAKDD